MAMYIAAAKRRFGAEVVPKLRGTIQADIFKEVQAQNETIFPVEASLRFLGDMMEWTTRHMPRWYPVSISGYHIGEAGSTPVQQAAYTLSNGFAYAEMMANRGMSADEFGPRLSFFLDCGLDVEYIALTRVSRRIWAIGMRDVFGAGPKAQLYKVHTQTSGRSLIAAEFRNTRPAFLAHERSKAELKALMPPDAKEAVGHGLQARRSKSGAVSFELQGEETRHAAL